jgi:hypothetical protein
MFHKKLVVIVKKPPQTLLLVANKSPVNTYMSYIFWNVSILDEGHLARPAFSADKTTCGRPYCESHGKR